MKKINKKLVIISTILIILVGSFYTYQKVNNRNAFEEMYNSYYSLTTFPSIVGMSKLEPISRDERTSPDMKLDYSDNTDTQKKYIFLIHGDDVIVSGKSISLFYITKISEEFVLGVSYNYDIENKKLSNNVGFYKEGSSFPTKEKETKELLEKYNISKEYLQKKSDELLDTVLTDWQNYSGSSYSKDNMGRLTIEKDEFLR